MNFLENGNIINSVNYPECDAGICMTEGRVGIMHMNIPNTISPFTAILAGENINISGMLSKSRGQYAYTLLDLDHSPSAHAIEMLKQVSGVIRVRVIK